MSLFLLENASKKISNTKQFVLTLLVTMILIIVLTRFVTILIIEISQNTHTSKKMTRRQ